MPRRRWHCRPARGCPSGRRPRGTRGWSPSVRDSRGPLEMAQARNTPAAARKPPRSRPTSWADRTPPSLGFPPHDWTFILRRFGVASHVPSR
jgi:hypothetical protein